MTVDSGSANPPWIKVVVLSLGVVALDRVTKALVVRSLCAGESREVLGDVFRITLVHNPGGAFGTKLGGNAFYIVAALVAAVVLIVWLLRQRHSVVGLTGISLMLGGALGNLWDRVAFGLVTDFIDIGVGATRWPTFNIADSAVTVGIALVILQEVLSTTKRRSAKPKQQEGGES